MDTVPTLRLCGREATWTPQRRSPHVLHAASSPLPDGAVAARRAPGASCPPCSSAQHLWGPHLWGPVFSARLLGPGNCPIPPCSTCAAVAHLLHVGTTAEDHGQVDAPPVRAQHLRLGVDFPHQRLQVLEIRLVLCQVRLIQQDDVWEARGSKGLSTGAGQAGQAGHAGRGCVSQVPPA